MIDVDHKQTEDFLAFVDDGALVGSAMIAIEPAGERAEVAIAVRADYKHQGVGWTLLNRAADHAKTRGCRTLEAVESRLKIGRAHVCTPVTNAQLVCRLLLAKKQWQYT